VQLSHFGVSWTAQHFRTVNSLSTDFAAPCGYQSSSLMGRHMFFQLPSVGLEVTDTTPLKDFFDALQEALDFLP
jgi:hypothetical protein